MLDIICCKDTKFQRNFQIGKQFFFDKKSFVSIFIAIFAK